ncbi:MAG: hypothetical protein CFH18_00882 [Alphaproteobacteria bacterium MarineAlpha5_Bin8]|nr:MAG: hypothetical protein CFH18_00882 [Alphaproteobacteria bacterium MarineAlpha5_Bin8]PPR46089.1 MAG: hypothetical protein CFH17_00191 [Alphaproteobacteria bacterium MarineAlpha5_Bin7]|tara:strand:- start:1000 stop:1374 length:375 start_codon:yes stop_codon:yes gene_type:complete
MTNKRPLSPHITVHKWILSQVMSILHRATAIGFSIGLLFISLWLVAFSLGQQYFNIFEIIFFNFFGKIIISIITFCFCFHFIDEFRKIFWSFGIGLDIKIIKVTSYFVILTSLMSLFLIVIYLL